MIRIISLFLITLVLLQSCTTISYTERELSSDKQRGLHLFTDIMKNNQTIYDANFVKEWFKEKFDTTKYALIGFNGLTAYIVETNKIQDYGAISNQELAGVYLSMQALGTDSKIVNTFVENSFYTVPPSQHCDAYKTLDRKYPIFLTGCIDETSEIKDLYIYASEIEDLNVDKVKIELRSKIAKKIFDRIQESFSNEIAYYNEWLNYYSKYEDGEILALRSDMIKKYQEIALSKYEVIAIQLKNLEEEQDFEMQKIKSNFTSYKKNLNLEFKKTLEIINKFIKHTQDKDLAEQLVTTLDKFANNITAKLKSSEDMRTNITEVFNKIEYFEFDKEHINHTVSESLSSKRNNLKEMLLNIRTKTDQSKQEVEAETQAFNVFVSEIHDKINSKEEELKHEVEQQQERLKEQHIKEQKSLIAKLEPGDCIQYRYITEQSAFLHTLATAATAFGLGDLWQTVQIIKIKDNIITVKYMENTKDHYAGQEAFLSISKNVFRKCK